MTRYCYLSETQTLKLVNHPAVLEAMWDAAGLGQSVKKAHWSKMSADEKKTHLVGTFDVQRKLPTSCWQGCSEFEIFAACLFRSSLLRDLVKELWSAVDREDRLLEPVARYFRNSGYEVYKEMALGRRRADLFAVGTEEIEVPGGFLRKAKKVEVDDLVVVELKNTVAEMDKCFRQLTTYRAYAHNTYLACTPAVAAAYLNSHMEAKGVHRWNPHLLQNELHNIAGLLLVEGDEVTLHSLEPRNELSRDTVDELLERVARLTPIATSMISPPRKSRTAAR